MSNKTRRQELADKIWEETATKEEITEFNIIVVSEKLEKAEERKGKSTRSQHGRQRGRYGERRLAKKVGGVVVGWSKEVRLPQGIHAPDGSIYVHIDIRHPPDVVDGLFSYESKWLKAAPVGIKKIMIQATKNAPRGHIPIGVIGDREAREVYYIMNEQDFIDLHCR